MIDVSNQQAEHIHDNIDVPSKLVSHGILVVKIGCQTNLQSSCSL